VATGTGNVLIEDFASQSRLTFLFYNALLQPSGDDATMKSIVVGAPAPNRATFTPTNKNSYFYSQLNCFNAGTKYGGISLRINAPAGSSFTIELGYVQTCGSTTPSVVDVTTTALGWTFDGTEKLYTLKWSQFAGVDSTKLNHFLITGFTKAISLGPIALYLGSTPSEYVVAPTASVYAPSQTVAAPAGTAAAKVIDKFANKDSNALGFWHGYDDGMTVTWGTNQVKIVSTDPDYAFYTQISAECSDFTSYEGSYLHIAYSGSTSFTIALQQHNTACNENINPYPATWDEVEASRYASNGNIYIPMSHFKIDKTKSIGFALKGWYTTAATTLTLVELVSSVPSGWQVDSKLPTGNLIFACKRPNSFAFCIDDGDPALAQQVMQIVDAANIKVTFFTLGLPLLDPSTNLSNIYKDMAAKGHQIAVHTYSHPKMEGLADYAAIDWEYNNDMAVVGQIFGTQPQYLRPPFGTEGARMRYRWAAHTGNDNAPIVMWSVDLQDWVWAATSTPEKQITAFESDVDKGGSISVGHYLYSSSVSYFPQLIQYVKSKGLTMMRLDQCMMDPNAPPL
jgi:peptidoglycan/xylan/chitin deacetylase (PgdA/CDA1 family)